MELHTHNVIEGETGFVTEVKGYLLHLEGLPSVHINDVVLNSKGQRALITALYKEGVEALLLDQGDPEVGDRFLVHARGIQFPFGDHLLGRAINALGDPLDGKGEIKEGREALQLDDKALGMETRATMKEQLYTGMAAVDVLLPLAKGQRQLVVGPISSGKVSFIESTIAHQKETSVISIYAFIGKPLTYVNSITSRLFSKDRNPNVIVISALSDEPAPLIYITPIVAFALADYFSKKGRDVLLVLDDFGTHAKYLREIALLAGRIPGRESYPGDMFYQHARLLERAGYFNKEFGGGSVTVLPILETNLEDTTNLVSTNLMSATDGHLFFSPILNAEGYFPSILSNRSVTRVGRAVQSNLVKQLSIRIQALLAEYEKQRDFSRFGTELSENTRRTISRGEILRVFLRQEPSVLVKRESQIILLALVFTQFFENHDTEFAIKNKDALMKALDSSKTLEPIVTSVERGTISLEQFTKKLQASFSYLESVCQQ